MSKVTKDLAGTFESKLSQSMQLMMDGLSKAGILSEHGIYPERGSSPSWEHIDEAFVSVLEAGQRHIEALSVTDDPVRLRYAVIVGFARCSGEWMSLIRPETLNSFLAVEAALGTSVLPHALFYNPRSSSSR